MLEKIKIEEILRSFEKRWPPRAIKKLKVKLFAKGLIEDCPCDKCEGRTQDIGQRYS